MAQDIFRGAIGDVVAVMYADDRGDPAGFGELADGDFGQADMADFPLLLKEAQGTDLVSQRHDRIDPVQLVQVNAVHSQPAQAELGLLGAGIRGGPAGSSPRPG